MSLCQSYGEGMLASCSVRLQNRITLALPRQVVGSREAALETVRVLRQVVSKAKFSNIDQLVSLIHAVGRRLVEAQPKGALLSIIVLLFSFRCTIRTHCWKYSAENPTPYPRRIQYRNEGESYCLDERSVFHRKLCVTRPTSKTYDCS